jgi:O-acetyl-ADP-ribose deacetylase (regulator of RNase III)
MPIVKKVKGDLLELFKSGETPLIAHGCNCLNIMGAGIAFQIAEQFPEAYKVDKEFPLPPLYRLGDYSVAKVEQGVILNFYTQYMPGANFEYSALKSCLRKLSKEAIATERYITLAVPMIGAGIGKGDWEIIEKLLEQQEYLLITVVEYEPQSGKDRVGEDDVDTTPET